MKKVAIIAAMDKELHHLFDFVKEYNMKKVGPRMVYLANYRNLELIITKCGIGKVNAALTTALLINEFDPDLIINTGIAGGVDKKLNPLDIIVAEQCAYSDVDCVLEGSDIRLNQIDGEPMYFPCSDILKRILVTRSLSFECLFGTIITSDKFIKSREQLDKVIDSYYDANVLACDMESCSIAQVCYHYHKDVVIVRAVSDVVGVTSQTDYSELSVKASDKSTEIISLILSRL